jgi:hypothetical protein
VKNNSKRSAVAVGLAIYLAANPGFAAEALPAIGTVVTLGAFRLNHATVRSNATLFEGAMVETGAAPARMDVASGTHLELEPESTGQIFDRRLVLERGATGVTIASAAKSGSAFIIAARGVTIQADGNAATGYIALIGADRIEVTARTGSFRALNSSGVLVAKISAGKALALEPQSMPRPARITGRLLRRGSDYLLTDETTNVTIEVTGSALTQADLKRASGQRVEVTGSAYPGKKYPPGAPQVIEVAQITPAPPASGTVPGDSAPAGAGGTAPAGAGGPAAGAGGGAASGAAVSATMIAIIGGVAAAAVVGGLAASGKLGASTAAPLSR